MYRVYVSSGGIEYPLYEPLDEETIIFEPVLTEEMGSAGSCSFKIHKKHPYFDKIKPCKSEIIVYENTDKVFYGRMLKPEQEFQNMVSILCEGELTYLLDSIQEPFSYHGNLAGYVGKLLEIYNSQVDNEKRIQRGNIVIAGDGNEEWEITDYISTLAALRRLSSAYGGHFRIRHEGRERYLDYLWDYGGVNKQVIRFGENLLDLTRYVDASQIVTCLIPEGGEEEYKNELGESQKRTVTIMPVNGGLKYIQNDEAIQRYGRIWGYKKFEDITDPKRLLEKAKAYLEEASSLPESMEVNAVDLSLIDTNIEQFKLGFWTEVESDPHGIRQRFLLTRREVNLLDPTQGSITLGRQTQTMTGNIYRQQATINQKVEKVAESTSEEINRKIENATTLITGGLGGYVVLDNIDPKTAQKTHPWRILFMNTPDKETATNVIQINQNGIGFSTTGINGPYRNAWTIDGNLVADFITTGTMLADRIRGGIMEMGGAGLGRDGSIIVMDADGNRIGSWDKTGLTILRGVLQGVSAVFGGLENSDGAIEVRDANGQVIGRWDKDGLSITKGVISGTTVNGAKITGGEVEIGALYADENGVQFGDFEVSADGSNRMASTNGWIELDTKARPQGSPGKEYALLKIAGDGYMGVVISGYGVVQAGTFEAGDVTFPHDPWVDGYSALQMFKQIYSRLSQVRSELGISWED